MKTSGKYPASVWLALASVYVVWGSTYLAIRFAIQTIPPFFMAGIRFLASGIILWGLLVLQARYHSKKLPRITWKHLKSAAVIGFFLLVVGNGGVCWAEQRVPSGLTALLVGTVPVWMVLLEWLWKKGANPGPRLWTGVFLGFTGIAVLVLLRPQKGLTEVDPRWALLLVCTSLAWSWGSLYARSAPLPSSALLATALEMVVGGLQQLATGFLLGEQAGFHPSQFTTSSVEAWIYLTLVGSLVGFTSYIWVLQKSTPDLASTYAFVNPIIAVFLGWLLAGESPTPSLFLAAALIVAAVVLITLAPRKKA
ncbi:MAG TPA: EamA family transporter [bacterium]|nr:EamA family transporter [bacterium]